MRNTQRLDKILANFGYGTRREVKQLVKDGLVMVDGVKAKDAGMQVDPENSTIDIKGQRLNYRRFIYLMMNKPAGVISATWDNRHKTVVDLLPVEYRIFNLFPAGRLDIDTEGLVLMTNDGQLVHDILSPRKHVPKRYYARIEGRVTTEDIELFDKGVTLEDGYVTLPAQLTVLKCGEESEIELVIHEGKFHQVKRMFEAVGKRVTYLKRISMGNLMLDNDLEPGACREMTEKEVNLLKGEQE